VQKRIKIVYVISHIDKALEFEWVISKLNREKYDLSFVLLNPQPSKLALFAIDNNINCTEIYYSSKRQFLVILLKLTRIFREIKPDIVHAHLIDASLFAMISSWICGVKGRICTRHHSSFHHVYFKKHVFIDKLINKLATKIIAVSPIVKEILIKWESCPEDKVYLVNHGLDFMTLVGNKENVQRIRDKYNINEHYPIIGVISRYIDWKGVQYIIPAFKELLKIYPQAKLILANAEGSYKKEILLLLKEIPENNYIQIQFEDDIFSLYRTFDLFLHVPIDIHSEAFGQIYIEALAIGIPSVFTLSGIGNEIIKDRYNALVIPYCNSGAIYESMLEGIINSTLRNYMIEKGKISVRNFTIQNKISMLESIYDAIKA
jgi:glycosyltransferase involved in cell wall biosynthesis